MFLAHGRAGLNTTFRNLRVAGPHALDGAPTDADAPDVNLVDVGRDVMNGDSHRHEARYTAQAHSWFSGRKRGTLSDFVVGTVDQILFSSLRARHLALRHLGLARKVVIIDEVHSYDAYMGTYLRRALQWLGAYGVPVILLSATLPSHLREALTDAYRSGTQTPERLPAMSLLGRPRRLPSSEAVSKGPDPDESDDAAGVDTPALRYPVITTAGPAGNTSREVAPSGRSTTITWQALGEDLLATYLTRMLSDGGCALVVRNTVGHAQRTARELTRHFEDGEVAVMHSRFIAHDRLANDNLLREWFGPPRTTDDRRPHRKIVVATQVVEQSLDIDVDILVTDLAPMDLMLQRIGRMHRHPRGQGESDRPVPLRQARCAVLNLPGVDDTPAPDPGAVRVYNAHTLLRAGALVHEILASGGTTTLPDAIAPLVHHAYGTSPIGPAAWSATMHHAARKADDSFARSRRNAETFLLAPPRPAGDSLLGWLAGSAGEADDSAQGLAQVRESEDSIEVLLLERAEDGTLLVPSWVRPHGGRTIPTDQVPDGGLARAMASCAVRLPVQSTRGEAGDALIEALEGGYVGAWQQERLLAGQFALPLEGGATTIAGQHFTYSREDGLEVTTP